MDENERPRVLGAKGIAGLLVAAMVAIAISACNSTTAASGGVACTYLQQVACADLDGCAGTATCLPDLSGFGPCACAPARAKDGGATDGGRRGDR